ncbi:MAG: alanine racemase [candidate division NC10 bacterium]|nr:alanine racemase [candidate division NC10 bacterium]
MRPTRAEIQLGAIAQNVATAKRLVGNAVQVMAVVKADAYGHGAVPVAKVALDAGATWLGVACPEEAVPLRDVGIRAPILVLSPTAPQQAEVVVRLGLDQCVSDPEQANPLAEEAAKARREVRIHLKVDTGMGRVGVSPREARRAVERLARFPPLKLVGLMTHFADAEAEDSSFSREQLRQFGEVVEGLKAVGVSPAIRHAANSAALLCLPESRLDLVRPGIMLYGCHPRGRVAAGDPALAPALRLRTEVSQLKDLVKGSSMSYGRTFVAPADIRVATLPIGYADGAGRLLSNRGEVLLRGKRVPIIGRVCMDMLMLDASRVPESRVGDEAVLIGRQGDEEITADEFAGWQGTISYEALCRIGPRVPRVYMGSGGACVEGAAWCFRSYLR